MARAQDRGRQAEEHATALLQRSGLVTVARNYRCRGGEIDLVMRDDDCLVFVEVRLRSHAAFGGALASVTATKQARLVTAARHYLASSGWPGPCRFDVVGFDGHGRAEWVRNVIET
ncbi:MAG: YraN family protein [Gammaproteobacteria bacterium]|nr:YraN family protein [Gammaproteobacteria bacterium]